MKPIAFLKSPNVDVTIQKTGFWDEAEILKPHFEKLGAQLVVVDWRDTRVNWSEFAFVIPKCAWDYFDHYSEFKAWLNDVEQKGIFFKNALSLIKWNADKRYLVEMGKQGASVAPLRLISDEDGIDSIRKEFERHSKILLKPAVSGGGKQTKVYELANIEQCEADAREILLECSVVIQPFMEDVAHGEWSFFFFGGEFSHAIKKVPHDGDFRAHKLFGAKNCAVTPSLEQIAEAKQILSYLPVREHYARVDGIYVAGKLLLIELELVEPYLYFEHATAEAPAAFARALMR